MIGYRGVFSAITFVIVFGSILSANAAPPVEAFGNLPTVTAARISPDGKNLAIIDTIGGHPGVAVFSLIDPTAKVRAAAFPDAVADSIMWVNSNRLICLFRANMKMKWQTGIQVMTRAISVAMDGGKAAVLLHDKPFFRLYHWDSGITDTDATDPNSVYMVADESNAEMNGDTPKVYDQLYLNLFRVNVDTGLSQLVLHGDDHTVAFLMDGSGHVVSQVEQSSDLRQHIMTGAREAASYSANGGLEWDIEGRTPDGAGLAVETYGAQGNRGLYTYGIGAAGLGAPLFADPKFDIDYALRDEMTGRVIGVAYTEDRMVYKYFDPAMEQIKERVDQALPGESVALVSHDATGATYVVSADGQKAPGSIYLFHPATGKLDRFKTAYPALSAADLSDVQPYPYKARDGLDIHAYLTLPNGKAAKNLPTVIFPHGGPQDRDRMEFDWWAQFMASRGYAVLQPNFRGSTGYGVAFRNAGFGQWGKKVQDDITDGVKKLIADGIADPKRICIVGTSYGGYAALAGATFAPDLYACAISYAGLSDLAQMRYRDAEDYGTESSPVAEWDQYMGGRDVSSQNESDASPAKHADQVKTPILLIHSDRDVTVLIEQSEIERDALQHAGKTVEFVKLSGDDHYLTQQDTRIQLLKEVERFLAAHIGT